VPAPPSSPWDPGPGPGGPGPLRPEYLASNFKQHCRSLSAFYWELTSCRGVSEAAAAYKTLDLQGHIWLAKWHLEFTKVVRRFVVVQCLGTNTQDIEEVCIYIYIYIYLYIIY
jgi:hypothetical protein